MKRIYTLLFALTILAVLDAAAAKTTKIKLTGTCNEQILLTVGQTGRTEIISAFPYILEVNKSELPIKLKFNSDHFLYYDIDVPKKPFDTTGHVYLVKINETAMQMQNMGGGQPAQPQIAAAQTQKPVIEGIDTSHGVNAAPLTGRKSENTFALIIANEQYDMAVNVDNATNDGLAFKEYCLRTLGIPNDNIKYASNLSFGRMKKTVNDMLELVDMMDGKGNLIIYYAGHGIPDNKTKDAFLMPVDADGTDTEVCMSLTGLYSQINSKRLNQCVVFLDACFSGAQRGGDMIVAARGVRLKPKEAAPEGKTIVFSATSGDQAAFSHKEEKHGLFTYYLLKKFQESKGNVSLGELAEYLTEKVGFESRRINNSPQTPTVMVAPGLTDKWKKLSVAK